MNPAIKLLGRQIQCAACGATFTCGAGTGDCWCARLPRVMTVPDASAAATCLCPGCLNRRIEAAAARAAPRAESS
jgi:hypothetical protein